MAAVVVCASLGWWCVVLGGCAGGVDGAAVAGGDVGAFARARGGAAVAALLGGSCAGGGCGARGGFPVVCPVFCGRV